MCTACVLFLPLLRLLIIRAASAPAVPAAAAAAHSAAHLLWPRGLSAAAGQSPAGPLRRTRVCFTLLSLRKMVSLDATTTSGYNQMVRCDLITCVLVRAARHDRRPLARRPSSQRARRMTGSVQRHFRDGRKASTGARRDTGRTGRTQARLTGRLLVAEKKLC